MKYKAHITVLLKDTSTNKKMHMNILQESEETQVKTLIDDVQDYQAEGQCADCTSSKY